MQATTISSTNRVLNMWVVRNLTASQQWDSVLAGCWRDSSILADLKLVLLLTHLPGLCVLWVSIGNEAKPPSALCWNFLRSGEAHRAGETVETHPARHWRHLSCCCSWSHTLGPGQGTTVLAVTGRTPVLGSHPTGRRVYTSQPPGARHQYCCDCGGTLMARPRCLDTSLPL